MNGLDLVVLAILSTTAIVIVGFAAKAYYILRNDSLSISKGTANETMYNSNHLFNIMFNYISL